jgi:hypothetical protein
MKISLRIRGLNGQHRFAIAFNWMLEQYFNGLLDLVNTFIGQFALLYDHVYDGCLEPRQRHRSGQGGRPLARDAPGPLVGPRDA